MLMEEFCVCPVRDAMFAQAITRPAAEARAENHGSGVARVHPALPRPPDSAAVEEHVQALRRRQRAPGHCIVSSHIRTSLDAAATSLVLTVGSVGSCR